MFAVIAQGNYIQKTADREAEDKKNNGLHTLILTHANLLLHRIHARRELINFFTLINNF